MKNHEHNRANSCAFNGSICSAVLNIVTKHHTTLYHWPIITLSLLFICSSRYLKKLKHFTLALISVHYFITHTEKKWYITSSFISTDVKQYFVNLTGKLQPSSFIIKLE